MVIFNMVGTLKAVETSLDKPYDIFDYFFLYETQFVPPKP